jgi:hypothetical protein
VPAIVDRDRFRMPKRPHAHRRLGGDLAIDLDQSRDRREMILLARRRESLLEKSLNARIGLRDRRYREVDGDEQEFRLHDLCYMTALIPTILDVEKRKDLCRDPISKQGATGQADSAL